MKFLAALRKVQILWFFILLFVIGLLFAGISGFAILHPSDDVWVPVQATISDLQEERDYDGDLYYSVYVDYQDADGNQHQHIPFGTYWAGMHEGDVIDAEYKEGEPETIQSPNSGIIVYVFFAIGVVCMIVSVVMTVKTAKTKLKDMNQFDRVNEAEVSPEEKRRVEESTEPTCNFTFHWAKKLNQSYVMKDENYNVIYEANCDRIGFFRPYIYTFVDKRTGSSSEKIVTHTMTTSLGSNNFRLNTNSRFKINDVNCWDYISQMGFSLEPHLDGLKLNFDVFHYGVKVAYVESAGVSVVRDQPRPEGFELPTTGVYRITCRESDVESVFAICFVVSRVEFF